MAAGAMVSLRPVVCPGCKRQVLGVESATEFTAGGSAFEQPVTITCPGCRRKFYWKPPKRKPEDFAGEYNTG